MPIGKVTFYDASEGHGFISPENGGKEAFVSAHSVMNAGLNVLVQGQRVSYKAEELDDKVIAVNVRLLTETE